ncbi:MAG: sensor histidine kinase [Muribaculaceae bacterium]|nr:sensor histidine kinase [Muribaculaceae bacterium]
MSYFKKRWAVILMILLPSVAYNLYFLFLLPEVRLFYLLYLDFLVVFLLVLSLGIDVVRYRKRMRKKKELLQQKYVIYREFEGEDIEIAAHDTAVLEQELQEQFATNGDLQDYIAKWCHEIKLPLTAALVMAEKIEEPSLKRSMQEQLERMNLQLRSALLGAKVQSSLFDLQIRETSLLACVKKSIHNNQFFLIGRHFTMQVQVENISIYTDPSWLTYVLDQLMNNAVKYAGENPVLHIYSRKEKESIRLYVEDNGCGILESDIRRIFEKGYTGSSYHDGQYKSTGMGLYLVSVILGRLGHAIAVESEYEKGTRFILTFQDNRDYFCK